MLITPHDHRGDHRRATDSKEMKLTLQLPYRSLEPLPCADQPEHYSIEEDRSGCDGRVVQGDGRDGIDLRQHEHDGDETDP